MATKNKLAAQIIKAEMLGDRAKVERLKRELESLVSEKYDVSTRKQDRDNQRDRKERIKPEPSHDIIYKSSATKSGFDPRVKKFLSSTSSLSHMFEQEKGLSTSDEARMFINTAKKFTKDDMETKYFSQEIDDSQLILNKSKRHKPEDHQSLPNRAIENDERFCFKCIDKVPKHLVIDRTDHVYTSLMNMKPFLSNMSNVTICNISHSGDSFISTTVKNQDETNQLIGSLKDMWASKGYRCIIMETYFKNRRPSKGEMTSGGNHYQVQCLPIKEKYYDRARMSFKQALQECEKEWSMNKKLILTDGKKIQRCLPRGLSYFWVCFDGLTNGFGHVVEQESEFSRYFGLEVLSGLLDKDFNPMRLDQREEYKDQFERSREFKLLYSKFKYKD